jgi:hypothetical protein
VRQSAPPAAMPRRPVAATADSDVWKEF